jgi:peptidoglycan-N-acetylglucosamine deacetylase
MSVQGSGPRSDFAPVQRTESLRIVTTSWDDGDPADLKLAELLSGRGLRGTFYVPLRGYQGAQTLSALQLRELSAASFEIGAHTVSHRSLSELKSKEVTDEVRDCKKVLEDTVGESVRMFCYPNGRYNAGVIREVERAGYIGARTTKMLSTALRFRRFEMPTSVQAFPHRMQAYLRNLGRARDVPGLVQYLAKWRRCKDWVDLGRQLFGRVLKSGGIWHLYGHSWEIEQLGLWSSLREMLDYVSGRADVAYLTNGQLTQLLRTGIEHQAEGSA